MIVSSEKKRQMLQGFSKPLTDVNAPSTDAIVCFVKTLYSWALAPREILEILVYSWSDYY